jgi:hypothetical protein
MLRVEHTAAAARADRAALAVQVADSIPVSAEMAKAAGTISRLPATIGPPPADRIRFWPA